GVPHGADDRRQALAGARGRAAHELRVHGAAVGRYSRAAPCRRENQLSGRVVAGAGSMSKGIFVGLTAAAIALSASGVAFGHHSAAQFDFGNQVQITGIVKYVRFANPHAKIILEVTDDVRGTRDRSEERRVGNEWR